MAECLLRPKAVEDLEGIWQFTIENRGEDQADQYIRDLEQSFQALTANPGLGRSCDDIREGYSKYPAGKHLIFYRRIPKGIEIVRVLHQSMDPDLHF